MSDAPFLDNAHQFFEEKIEEIAGTQTFQHTPLKSSEMLKEDFKESLRKNFDVYKINQRVLDCLNLIQTDLHLVADQATCDVVFKEIEGSNEALVNFVKDPNEEYQDFQKVFGFSNESVEAIYSLGCYYFSQNEIESAQKLFELLTYLTPHVSSHWISSGLCHENKHELESALICYRIAADLNPENIGIICYIRCLSKLGHRAEALHEIDILENEATLSDELKEQLKALKSSLKL